MCKVTIKHGNALSLFKTLPDSSVDLIVADPPYNLGKDYGNNSDNMSVTDYLTFTRKWLIECDRVLSANGSIYVFSGVKFISHIYNVLEDELDYKLNSWITWHYSQGVGKTKGFSPRHDDILFFNKSSKFTFNLDPIRVPQKSYRIRNNMRGANPGDVWEFPHVHCSNKNRLNHPTQKPEGLIERIVLASSNEGDFVLDPFSGSGTTLRVCQQLNRTAVGFELNADYVKSTLERLDAPFTSFDTIDPKFRRVPLDISDKAVYDDYLSNHVKWFLDRHQKELKRFKKELKARYPQFN